MLLELSLEQWLDISNYATNELNISSISKADCDLSAYIPHYNKWIDNNYHADMDYMTNHGDKRSIPNKLIEGTNSIIVATLDYLNRDVNTKSEAKKLRSNSNIADISIYAHGRDYHKVMKKKLQKLAEYISNITPGHEFRVFTDSAPVLERPLAEKAGLGWQGKNSMLMNTTQGSFFFIGVIYSNLDLSKLPDKPIQSDICGKCKACISICPTDAILPGKMIDSRRCVSYLTIENKNAIPLEFRDKIGTRIYGCDDCQLICPFNNGAPLTVEKDFNQREFLVNKPLIELYRWSEEDFLKYTTGSAIRRIGYRSWIRNITVAIGNSIYSLDNIKALETKRIEFSNDDMILEHIDWAINKQNKIQDI